MAALTAAEARQSAIETTLDYVETQQAELSNLLDSYEEQVSELLENAARGASAYGGGAQSLEHGKAESERTRT